MVIITTELVRHAEKGDFTYLEKDTTLSLRNGIAGFDLFFTIVMLIIMMIQFQQMGG